MASNAYARAQGIDYAGARYSRVAIVLHWLVAMLVLFNIWLGWQLEDAPRAHLDLYFDTHKSIGVTVLGLMFLRLLWRIAHRPPAFPSSMTGWQKALAATVHWGFYFVLVALPVTGLIGNSTNPPQFPLFKYFGMVQFPVLPWVSGLQGSAREAVNAAADRAHLLTGWCACALLVLHLLGALRHHFFSRDPVLRRMLPLAVFQSRPRNK